MSQLELVQVVEVGQVELLLGAVVSVLPIWVLTGRTGTGCTDCTGRTASWCRGVCAHEGRTGSLLLPAVASL